MNTIAQATISIKRSLANDLGFTGESQDAMRRAIATMRGLTHPGYKLLLSILDRIINLPTPGQTTNEKVHSYTDLTKAVFQASQANDRTLDDFLQVIAVPESPALPSSLGLLVAYAKYNQLHCRKPDIFKTNIVNQQDKDIRKLFEDLANINKFNAKNLKPLYKQMESLLFSTDDNYQTDHLKLKNILARLYITKQFNQRIENSNLEEVKKLSDLNEVLGNDFKIVLNGKFEELHASEDSKHKGLEALLKVLRYFKKHNDEDSYAVFNDEIKLIIKEAPSEIYLNNFFVFLNDLFDAKTEPSYELLKNSINKFRLQAYHNEFLAEAQFYENGSLYSSLARSRLIGLNEQRRSEEGLQADLVESRELLYQHLGFNTLQYDAARASGQSPLLQRFAEDVGSSAPLKIKGDSKRFPGKGFIMNGIDLYKAFCLGDNDQASLKSYKAAFNNVVSDKAFDLASKLKITTLKGNVILSHANITAAANDTGKELPYSLVIYNNHFRKGSPVEVVLVATSVLDKFIEPASYAADAKSSTTETQNISDSDLSIANLVKESKQIGANVYDLLHHSNFVSGISHIAVLNEDLSYSVPSKAISNKISKETRPLYLELMRLFKIAYYHYKSNSKVRNLDPETNKLGIQSPYMDLMAQELLNWHEHYKESESLDPKDIPILCFTNPLSWSISDINIYIDPVDLTFNYRDKPDEAFTKVPIENDNWNYCINPVLYWAGSNKFIEPSFISRTTLGA